VEELNTHAQFAGPDVDALFAVADGMGGEANGEFASLAAVQALRSCCLEKGRTAVSRCFSRANAVICREIERTGQKMGSTLATLYIDNRKATVCNIGDSRVYLLRNNHLTQISTDHTQVQQMVDLGILTLDEAKDHPNRHVLTQHLGIHECDMIIQPTFSEELQLEAGDTFLLCSDGLTDMVKENVIQVVLSTGIPEEQAQELVDEALRNGGKDNVTVLVVKVTD
jgi:protein phosphatase